MKFTVSIVALCLSMAATTFAAISTDGSCGGATGNTCLGSTFGDCCSNWGWWYVFSPCLLCFKLWNQRITPSQRKLNHSLRHWLPDRLRHLHRGGRRHAGWHLWGHSRVPLYYCSGVRELLFGKRILWEYRSSLRRWMVRPPFLLALTTPPANGVRIIVKEPSPPMVLV